MVLGNLLGVICVWEVMMGICWVRFMLDMWWVMWLSDRWRIMLFGIICGFGRVVW